MTFLRGSLGILLGLALAGWMALAVLGDGFRRSFGASPASLLLALGPPAGLALMLAALAAPQVRPLLHAGAAAAGLLAVFTLREMVQEGAPSLALALLVLALWFVFYALALRAPAPPA